VLLVTLAALAAFDVAAVTALRTYLIGQTDTQLRSVLGVYRLVNFAVGNVSTPSGAGAGSRRPAQERAAPPGFRPPNASLSPALRLQAPILQPYWVQLVSGKTVKGVSPSVAIRGVVVGGAALAPQLPENLSALAASGQGQTVASLRGNQQLRIMAAPDPARASPWRPPAWSGSTRRSPSSS